jgi:hypothetical protein
MQDQSAPSIHDRNVDMKNMTQEQSEQMNYELEEQRLIMNKRRKRLPLIEEFNLNEVLTES